MRKMTFLLLLVLPFPGFAQTGQTEGIRKFGVGIGYHFNQVMSDSIRPVELSLRYRINDRHTVQLYAPVGYKRSSIRGVEDARKETLWGIGLGYDYTFYSYSHLDFFAGLSADYQWYQYRLDQHYKTKEYYGESLSDYYIKELTYFYWDKFKSLNLIPTIGIRFVLNKITMETGINLLFSDMRKKSYSFQEDIYPSSLITWQSFYPDKEKKDTVVQAGGSIHLYYYF